jgi:hypothetical protein
MSAVVSLTLVERTPVPCVLRRQGVEPLFTR